MNRPISHTLFYVSASNHRNWLRESVIETLRIDRWLFYCRFFKTRVLASAAVTGGHVRVNGQKISPGHKIRCDDTIDLSRDRLPYSMLVRQLPTHRGPATAAQDCYVDNAEVAEKRRSLIDELRRDRREMATTPGRPDKHTQRLLRTRNRAPKT